MLNEQDIKQITHITKNLRNDGVILFNTIKGNTIEIMVVIIDTTYISYRYIFILKLIIIFIIIIRVISTIIYTMINIMYVLSTGRPNEKHIQVKGNTRLPVIETQIVYFFIFPVAIQAVVVVHPKRSTITPIIQS